MGDTEAQDYTMIVVLDSHDEYGALRSKQVSFPVHLYFTPK